MPAIDPQTYQDVAAFVAEELALPPGSISPLSRLRQDLGVTEDNADELMQDFFYVFAIDPGRFRVNDYFGPQPVKNQALAYLLWLFGNARPLKNLTVLDLCKAAERRRF